MCNADFRGSISVRGALDWTCPRASGPVILQKQIATRAKVPDKQYERKPQQAQYEASLTRKTRRNRTHFYLAELTADRNFGKVPPQRLRPHGRKAAKNSFSHTAKPMPKRSASRISIENPESRDESWGDGSFAVRRFQQISIDFHKTI